MMKIGGMFDKKARIFISMPIKILLIILNVALCDFYGYDLLQYVR